MNKFHTAYLSAERALADSKKIVTCEVARQIRFRLQEVEQHSFDPDVVFFQIAQNVARDLMNLHAASVFTQEQLDKIGHVAAPFINKHLVRTARWMKSVQDQREREESAFVAYGDV